MQRAPGSGATTYASPSSTPGSRRRAKPASGGCRASRWAARWRSGCASTSWRDARLPTLAALAPAPTWPVAFALAGVATGAPLREVLLAFAFGWAENLTQAAMKTIPLGQAAGQRLLAALGAEIPRAASAAARLSLDDMQAFTPMLAILSSQHEAQYSRLFRS